MIHKDSPLFQEISPQQISAVFRQLLGAGEVGKHELLPGGLFNTTYYVEYDGGQAAVLRLAPVNRQLILGFETHLMEAEAEMCRRCRDLEIPCSEILALDTSKALLDRDIMIVRYIPSCPMSENLPPEQEQPALYRQIGQYLARLHRVTGAQFGYLSRQSQGIGFSSWSDALLYEVEDMLQRSLNTAALEDAEAAAVRAVFQAHRSLLDEITVPHLLHCDIWAGNILLDDQRQIAAVIDGDRAMFGDPDFEFASGWMAHPALLEGYGIRPAPSQHQQQRIQLYRLYYALMETYIWHTEYAHLPFYQEHHKRLQDILGKLQKKE